MREFGPTINNLWRSYSSNFLIKLLYAGSKRKFRNFTTQIEEEDRKEVGDSLETRGAGKFLKFPAVTDERKLSRFRETEIETRELVTISWQTSCSGQTEAEEGE